jgi:co-chaperonin GroES (HSP10)
MIVAEKKLPVLPRNDLVLVEMDEDEVKTSGGIFMAKGKKARRGTVRAVGPGALSDNLPAPHRLPMDLKVGDRVHLSDAQCGHEFDSDEGRFILVPQLMIFGVLP